MEGIVKAKERGVYRGRKPSVDVKRVKELRDGGMGGSAIAKELGIGRASVYRALD
jgi:DNA invertase Pin-like site-specific DNA recombinase